MQKLAHFHAYIICLPSGVIFEMHFLEMYLCWDKSKLISKYIEAKLEHFHAYIIYVPSGVILAISGTST